MSRVSVVIGGVSPIFDFGVEGGLAGNVNAEDAEVRRGRRKKSFFFRFSFASSA
jgi:hypothetical protein